MEELVEKICRAICKAEKVDPDQIGYGLGISMPEGTQYPLWHARKKIAKALIAELNLA